MSTDHQRYSIENQAAVIATYAQVHQISIVRTYRDDGQSGLKLKNRSGLMQLLADINSGYADFGHILVYDVSRWGRFQDTDESAHYEFMCKQAGVKVTYCAEQFDNDGTMLSSIVKNLKRVMAAEFSRELSVKVHAGASRFIRLGFASGGHTPYGLRRLLLDENQKVRAVLKSGERKFLQTDHVKLIPGPDEEVTVVKWIFEHFLLGESQVSIANELNQNAIPTNTGRPWNADAIGRILRNENYIGNLVYNRRSFKLKEKKQRNPPELWVRAEHCIEPIIELEEFLQAERIIKERRVEISEEEKLVRLRKLLMKNGKLNRGIVDRAVGIPRLQTYQKYFGSVRNAYRLVGYVSKVNCDYLESRGRWAELMAELASYLSRDIGKLYTEPTFSRSTNCLILDTNFGISFRLARRQFGRKLSHLPFWSINFRAHLVPGWVVSIRLNEQNTDPLDYLLIPTPLARGRQVRFSEPARLSHGIERFASFDVLARTLVRRLAKRNHSASASRIRPKQPQRERLAKTARDHGRR
jgi:DNA invertase Pin-like site-specific DNA recombinase